MQTNRGEEDEEISTNISRMIPKSMQFQVIDSIYLINIGAKKDNMEFLAILSGFYIRYTSELIHARYINHIIVKTHANIDIKRLDSTLRISIHPGRWPYVKVNNCRENRIPHTSPNYPDPQNGYYSKQIHQN